MRVGWVGLGFRVDVLCAGMWWVLVWVYEVDWAWFAVWIVPVYVESVNV
jgi:hypothetical protein